MNDMNLVNQDKNIATTKDVEEIFGVKGIPEDVTKKQ